MRVADVIGNVTLSTCHPTLRGATWLVALPLSLCSLPRMARASTGIPHSGVALPMSARRRNHRDGHSDNHD